MRIQTIINEKLKKSSSKDINKIGRLVCELSSDKKIVQNLSPSQHAKYYIILLSYYKEKIYNQIILEDVTFKSYLMNLVHAYLNNKAHVRKL